jgi:hypothetical protein
LPRDFFSLCFEAVYHHFESLPGALLAQKLTAQFFRFENRLHFGMEATTRHAPDTLFFPLHSPTLMELARRVDGDAMRLGTIVFHVTREMNEEAAYLPHNIPAPDSSSHTFHTPSPYDTQRPIFSPDMAFFEEQKAMRQANSKWTAGSPKPYAPYIHQMVETVIKELSEDEEGRTYLTPGVLHQVRLQEGRPGHSYRAWLSRLASIRDVLFSGR